MTTIRSAVFGLLGLLLFFSPIEAQNRTRFGGHAVALDYAYGRISGIAPLTVAPNSSTAAGVGTLTLNTGWTTASDGTTLFPMATNAPVTIGQGSTQETVTPSAVASGCTIYGIELQCTFTATFTYAHGNGENVVSGTLGVQEAVNYANANGGGVVDINGIWARNGGTNAIIATVSPTSSVVLEDNRSSSTVPFSPLKYWTMQPTTLTVLGAPTTLTATNIVFTSATGTWAASSTHFLATCVDGLGGESAGSADYTQTPTLNYTLTVPVPPTCSTGSVGWRLYAGTSSAAVSYLLPITSSNCTLTTLESVIPACALTATGTWAATFATTTAQVPLALGVVNQINPVPQGHTTFQYEPTGTLPVPFQAHYGPFGSGTVATATASQNTVLGTVHLPTGYLNQIGRTIRITGKIIGGATAGGTLVINAALGWAGGDTAGAPVAVCIDTTTSALGTQTYTIPFSCTMTTNAVGATAIGSIQADSWLIAAAASTTNIVGADTGVAAVGSLGLFSQNDLYIYIFPATHDMTAVRLMDLHIETLQ